MFGIVFISSICGLWIWSAWKVIFLEAVGTILIDFHWWTECSFKWCSLAHISPEKHERCPVNIHSGYMEGTVCDINLLIFQVLQRWVSRMGPICSSLHQQPLLFVSSCFTHSGVLSFFLQWIIETIGKLHG